MVSILIVDDEHQIRQGMEVMVRRIIEEGEIPHHCFIKTAVDGMEALALVAKEHFDIIITDIKMPHLNGIAFMGEVRNRELNPFFIILSGFSEFTFAQEAIHHGASAYLLKPVDRTELRNSLLAIIKTMEKTCGSREKRLYQLLRSYQPDIDFPFIQIETSSFYPAHIIVLSIPHKDRLPANHHRNLKDRILIAIRRKISIIPVMYCLTPHIIFLSKGNTGEMKDVLEIVRKETGIGFSAAISPVLAEPKGFIEAYRETFAALVNNLLVSGEGENAFLTGKHTWEMSPEIIQSIHLLFSAMEQERNALVFHKLENLLETIQKDLELKKLDLLTVSNTIIEDAVNLIPEKKTEKTNRFTSCVEKISDPSGFLSFSEMAQEIELLVSQLLEALSKKPLADHSGSAKKIRKLLQWLDTASTNPNLSMTDAAENAGLGYSYFSSRFSQVTGKTFVHYIQDLRIEKARHLLADSRRSIKVIALQTGFPDRKKFSQVFRKKVGMSPLSYRRQAML